MLIGTEYFGIMRSTKVAPYFLTGECRPSEFQCFNSKCISGDLLCNGKNDCGDLSDEKLPCRM